MSIYDFEVTTIRGEKTTLAPYQGQVLLIVNTATKCGFAPQFKGLQKLHDTYRDKGFAVLGFPSSQFLDQELHDNADIAQSCELNHGVSFPLYAKIDVNGSGAHPLFQYLSSEARGLLGSKAIKWNFTKFLVDRNGRVLKRFAPTDTPEMIESRIAELLDPAAV
ncbi:glutathione peroxidase [Paenibacillus mucilaginosus]|uniref:Glutathione peroxidase n=2 Tax=Paenibacillus mucilaginosus TaxID=61624 RepID=H6NNP3_9BACL|nr:glutathione peroxidase [Paenibacillus mucilaginosus]AEI45698.1 BsaA2 [Paenibacillus mucilaginosus KNP414]AFC33364.1 BsaA2 [Paenibacillus mucilaginosus 3016]MCG7215113.1 glutathione peroxidase [Paenibacillus mucilaginosus]WDM27088.1 glutathione peroxidase [Paenibacillus mucilaginosus]WFA21779.1 glutathione peroxidase [Paenibacillus mucilaginosus]